MNRDRLAWNALLACFCAGGALTLAGVMVALAAPALGIAMMLCGVALVLAFSFVGRRVAPLAAAHRGFGF